MYCFGFADLVRRDACAWNMFGLLQERMGLLKPAEAAYRSALDDRQETNPENRDLVVTNLGRVLIAEGRFPEAAEVLQKVRKATFASQCTLALALYKGEGRSVNHQRCRPPGKHENRDISYSISAKA